MLAVLPRRIPGSVSGIRLRLGDSACRRHKLVGLQIVTGIKMKRDACGGGLKRVRVHVMNDGHDLVGIAGVFHGKILRTEVKGYSRSGGARGQLRVQHFVDLSQARIGSVPVLLAAGEREDGENAKQEEAGGTPW